MRKKRIFGHFFGIYLYRDDLGQILRELGLVLVAIGRYLRYVLPPLAVIIIPVLLVCAQLQIRYGYRGLEPGEEVNVSLWLTPGENILRANPILIVPAGITLQTPALRIEESGEADWRIRADAAGNFILNFSAGGKSAAVRLTAAKTVGRIYPVIGKPALSSSLTSPGGPTLSLSSPIEKIAVDYPTREVGIFGVKLHWTLAFLVLILLFGFSLRKPLKVDF